MSFAEDVILLVVVVVVLFMVFGLGLRHVYEEHYLGGAGGGDC